MLLRLAKAYLARKDYSNAKLIALRCVQKERQRERVCVCLVFGVFNLSSPLHRQNRMCVRCPSPVSWKIVGIACFELQDSSEAEAALAEANRYDNNDPEVNLIQKK